MLPMLFISYSNKWKTSSEFDDATGDWSAENSKYEHHCETEIASWNACDKVICWPGWVRSSSILTCKLVLLTLVDLQLDAQNFVYLHIIHLLKSSTCFEHYPAHLQEVDVAIVYMQPLVSLLSAGDCRLCWYRLVLVVWFSRFYYTRWRHCFCTILFWSFCIGISVLLV